VTDVDEAGEDEDGIMLDGVAELEAYAGLEISDELGEARLVGDGKLEYIDELSLDEVNTEEESAAGDETSVEELGYTVVETAMVEVIKLVYPDSAGQFTTPGEQPMIVETCVV
jgi:hypothetical protein